MRLHIPGTKFLAAFAAASITWGLLAFATSASAEAFRNPPESASGLGKIGARYSGVDDASALTFNPANLTALDKPSAMASLTLLLTDTDYDSPAGASGSTRGDFKYLPNLHAAFPLEDQRVIAGLGVTTPFGQSTEWSQSGPFRGTAPYFAELGTVNFNPSLAYKLCDSLSVGAGADIFYSRLTLKQIVPFSAIVPGSTDGRVKLEGDGTGFGGNVGVTWNPTARQRVAATYRSSVKVEYSGDTDISSVPGALGGLVLPDSDFDSGIRFPAIVGLGYGLDVSETVELGVDVEWLQFSTVDQLTLDLGANNASGLFPASVPQEWEDIWTVGAGAEWQFRPAWALRGGWIFIETPIPDETFSPALPDADRHVLSIGLGYAGERQAVDLAYAYNLFDEAEITTAANPAFNGDYDLLSHLLALSYSCSF